jgi:hypothetical protein
MIDKKIEEPKAMTPVEIQHLLYEDEDGDVVGLDEVQLLDPPPVERIPAVKSLLHDNDLYLVYQAAIVLAAWGVDEGLDKIEAMIDERFHTVMEFAPHRIDGYDNVYDEFAYAVHLYGLTGKRLADRKRIYGKLLSLYGSVLFQGELKYVLLNCEFPELAAETIDAMKRALSNGHEYLASQLLPVLARWEPEQAWEIIPRFRRMSKQTPDPAANVAEALGYIDTDESRKLLRPYLNHTGSGVAEEAKRSFIKLWEDKN